jgi:hypothetical protein
LLVELKIAQRFLLLFSCTHVLRSMLIQL